MATMRNTMVIIVFQIIQCATSQPLATDTVNSLIPEPTHESSTYECLFIDPTLPICDPKLLDSQSEEESSDKDSSDKEMQRSKRNTDISTKDVIVYTVEGCVPSIMPVSMPSCEGISFSRIIDVQRFRPFMVTKLSKPPFVFPTIDYSQWSRMVKRIKDRASKI
ncbi:hypothetical protein QLX08_006555 [Tetragonisca angustula]|uniref:Uncharacterized protein n=1 Tax=Tetragonisca angustula TaxID=166442 RepID=A0AAW0ZSX2_9HYME